MTCDPKHKEPEEEPLILPDDIPVPAVPTRKDVPEYDPQRVSKNIVSFRGRLYRIPPDLIEDYGPKD